MRLEKKWASRIGIIAALSGLSGCQRDDPAAAAITFLDDFATAACQWRIDCGNIAAEERDACRITMKQEYDFGAGGDLAAEVRAGHVVLDTAAAKGCVSLLNKLPCDGGLDPFLWAGACARALRHPGQLPKGASCTAPWQCSGGICVENSTCPWKCVAWLATGMNCVDAPGCDPGKDYCAGNEKCTPVTMVAGGPCDGYGFGGCDAGLLCAPNRRCAVPLRAGAPCRQNDQVCDYGLGCDPRSLTCQPLFAGVGSRCYGEYGSCQRGLACIGTTTSPVLPGTCAPRLDVGASCQPSPPEAANPLITGCPIDAECGWKSMACGGLRNGADCYSGYGGCQEGYCDPATQKCVPPAAWGAACTPPPDGQAIMVFGYGGPCALGDCDSQRKICVPHAVVCQ